MAENHQRRAGFEDQADQGPVPDGSRVEECCHGMLLLDGIAQEGGREEVAEAAVGEY